LRANRRLPSAGAPETTCVVIERVTPVELGDALIAASGALLWTRNRQHYPMPDLAFYD
jgi:hypothetical protein